MSGNVCYAPLHSHRLHLTFGESNDAEDSMHRMRSNEILPMTAERTGGLCMPCKQGIRENIEKSKEYNRKQKGYDPVRELWKSLVNRVYNTDAGFAGLSEEEKTYFVVCILDGETYNGGIEQFFSNSSGEYYSRVLDGLLELEAFETLKLLKEAKEILFEKRPIPTGQRERYEAMRHLPENTKEKPDWYVRLDQIDGEYYEDPNGLGERLEAYAESKGLIEPFKKGTEQVASRNPDKPVS